jgi:hypothetical protein
VRIRSRPKKGPDAGAREFAQLQRSDGPLRPAGPTKIGVVPLSDGAGEVAALFKTGDRIAGCFHPRWFGGPIKPDYQVDRFGDNATIATACWRNMRW